MITQVVYTIFSVCVPLVVLSVENGIKKNLFGLQKPLSLDLLNLDTLLYNVLFVDFESLAQVP